MEEKKDINFYNFYPYFYNGKYTLSGTAEFYPGHGKNVRVYNTTAIVSHRFDEKTEELVAETRNSVYHCPLKYLNPDPYQNVVESHITFLSHMADGSDDILDRIIAAMAKLRIKKGGDHEMTEDGKWVERKPQTVEEDDFFKHLMQLMDEGQKEIKIRTEKEHERLMKIASGYEDCVYLEVSNIERGNPLAYHIGDECGVIDPSVHSGMFQDSILYMQYWGDGKTAVDFRYFPKGFGDVMETYSWSDNIKHAVIKNDTDPGVTISFNGQEIPAGETKVFTDEGHREGLVSPDCFNGKSMLGDFTDE